MNTISENFLITFFNKLKLKFIYALIRIGILLFFDYFRKSWIRKQLANLLHCYGVDYTIFNVFRMHEFD